MDRVAHGAQPTPCCVTLGKSQHFSGQWFLHLSDEDEDFCSASPLGLRGSLGLKGAGGGGGRGQAADKGPERASSPVTASSSSSLSGFP